MGTARYQTLAFIHPHFLRRPKSHATFYLAVAVAVFCAASVFFLLCERDHLLLQQSNASDLTRTAVHTSTLTAPVAPAAVSTAKRPVQQISFSIARSRHFHRVGPISLGLWRIDARQSSFDLSILAFGHRINKSRVNVNEKVSVDTKDPAQVLEIVFSRIDRNAVSGYLVQRN